MPHALIFRATLAIAPAVALAVALAATRAAADPSAREPVVGRPCEGCEAIFDGLPAAPAASARLAPADEPGDPMVLSGRVLGRDGQPRAGVVIYAYQTDASGRYPPGNDARTRDGRLHGRLRAWVASDADGRYRFDTVRPGGYPGEATAQHIHLHVLERGCATYYIDDVEFTDDPRLAPQRQASPAPGRGGPGIVTPRREGRGWSATRDIVLGQAIPGHPGCP